ncbi:unnamed protein product [Rhizoctonia solani]|uniref:Fibronectin type-III domain-containing protein n=1 Tax=Rhizoctonia solani TaxID=456999 RepID=A0A8H3E8N0_9AGAM|nr:unnamed protein product [Rhizoctonia solani]
MLYYLLVLSLVTLVLQVAAQAPPGPSINTPASLVQCQPTQLTWNATHTPVWISCIPGGNPSAPPLKDLGQHNGTSLTWIVDLPKDTLTTFQLRDMMGAVAYTAPLTVQGSSDSSCVH